MCDFCENILDENSEEGIDRNHIFVRKDGSYWIFAETGDRFCVGNVANIKFCPYCGRKLSDETNHLDSYRQKVKEVAEEMPGLGKYDGDYAFPCGAFGYMDGLYRADFSCSNCGKRHESVIFGTEIVCECGKKIKTCD